MKILRQTIRKLIRETNYREMARQHQLKMWKAMSLQDLEKQEEDSFIFISGQLEDGRYDHEDIYGDHGHVAKLEAIRDMIDQKRAAQGMANRRWFDPGDYRNLDSKVNIEPLGPDGKPGR